MNMPFTTEELKRYSRHFTLPEVGTAGQQKLKNARVLCIGAGGLGSPLLLYLTAAGVGTIGVMDNDVVDITNLQRQVLYSTHEVNQKKISAAKAHLNRLNPHVNVITYDQRLTEHNALSILSQYDIIADGTDNFETRYLINDASFHLQKPNVYASIFQFEGQCSVFNAPEGVCYRCLYDSPPPPGLVPNCAEGGVFGVLPGLMGVIQASEVIKLILGIGAPLVGRLLTVDALTMRFQEFKLQRNPECRLCVHQQPFHLLPRYQESCTMTNIANEHDEITPQQLSQLLESKTDFILLDVREPHEYEICNLNGYLIPLGQLSDRLNELDKNKLIVVHCKMGGRGQKAVCLLQEAGFKSVKNLAGGILAWAKQIDPHLPIY